jgi:hypothetical protein
MARVGRLAAVALLVAAVLGSCAPLASKGTMPPPGPNGQVDPSAAPDFIAVAGRDGGVAGYVLREMLLPAPADGAIPVYGEDLRTVVGQMIPDKGFVPAGVDPSTVPTFPIQVAPSGAPAGDGTGQVVLYVRNDAASQAWIAVHAAGQLTHGTGFWGGAIGAGCYPMPAGSRLVLLDRSPTQPGAQVVRPIYSRGQEAEPPSLWVTIGGDGVVTQGTDVPAWWGEPLAC